MGLDDWIEVFKTGLHTDSSGNKKNWTQEELHVIASKYNPAFREAPVCIGHPRDNKPSWAWVKGMKVAGDKLLAQFRDIVPEFKDLLEKKMFKKRSISLYPDLTLRHIAFLGAAQPAVPGLKDIQFQEDPEAITIEFEDFENIRMEKNPKNGGNKMPGEDEKVKALEEQLRQQKEIVSNFAEKEKQQEQELQNKKAAKMQSLEEQIAETQKTIADFQKKEEALKKENEKLQAALQKIEDEKREKRFSDHCEQNITRITPALKADYLEILEACHQAGSYNFSEGGEKPIVDKIMEFTEKLPEQASLKEFATKEKAVEAETAANTEPSNEFSELEKDGYTVNKKELEAHKKASDYAKEHNISIVDAIEKVGCN